MNLAELWDTPGYFYALGYAFSAIVVVDTQLLGSLRWRDALSQLALIAFLVMLMAVTSGWTNAVYIVTMVTVILTLFLTIFQTVRDPLKTGFYALKAFIYGEFSASACWLCYYYLALKWEELQNLPGQIVVMALAYGILFSLFFFVERRLYRRMVDLNLGARELLIVFLTALTIYIVSNLGYLDRNGPFSGSYARDVFAIRTLVDLSGTLMIYAFHSQLIELQVRFENDTLHNIMETQYQAYQLSRESIDMVNQKYHDLKHQIALLKAQTDSGKSREYLRQMERDIQAYEARHQTGHPVLDAMLTSKSLYCQKHGIELKFIADGKLLNFMEDMDISALFGNMLDNAIESVDRLEDPSKRLIRLMIAGENNFLRIRIENYCEERIRFQNGVPLTTKHDRRYHGFGMKSMQRTVTKYGGSLIASQRDNWFELKILIPMTTEGIS